VGVQKHYPLQFIGVDGVTGVAATESPPIKEESSNIFWQIEARAKSLGDSPKT